MSKIKKLPRALDGKIIGPAHHFAFKDVHTCSSIVAMPPNFQFTKVILHFVEMCFGLIAYDAFAIPSFSEKLEQQSETVFQTLNIADKSHEIEKIFIFQTSNAHEADRKMSFSDMATQDSYHIRGLLKSYELIAARYPRMKVFLFYITLSEDLENLIITEIIPGKPSQVRLFANYMFKGIYSCETALVRCIEFRTRKADKSLVRNYFGFDTFGLIGLPGASKRFLEGSESAWQSIRSACNTDGCKELIVVHHSDCGAYKGVANFNGDQVEEEIMHRKEMEKFADLVYSRYPKIKVIPVYARIDFEEATIEYVLIDRFN